MRTRFQALHSNLTNAIRFHQGDITNARKEFFFVKSLGISLAMNIAITYRPSIDRPNLANIPKREKEAKLLVRRGLRVPSGYKMAQPETGAKFLGFGGMNKVRFRGTVVPGDRFIIVVRNISLNRRLKIFDAQGIAAGKLVFEASISGIEV